MFDLVTSDHILGELRIAWSKPHWRARISPDLAMFAEGLIREFGIVTPVTTRVSGIADHVEDDLIIATAIDGDATTIVTGDKGLLRVATWEGITIITPDAFVVSLGWNLTGGQ